MNEDGRRWTKMDGEEKKGKTLREVYYQNCNVSAKLRIDLVISPI